uniref:NGFI-A-binding protein 2 n=1 Tax=Knipowitschia caucasica TaxID=637954 RepID=A0AAV2M3N9_KNICA
MSLPRTLGELQLYRVLQRANLLSYYDTFIQQGGDDVQQLCEAAEEEFLEIMALVGMATKPLHVRRLQKALRDWASNPALFSQPVASLPLGALPLFKVDGTRAGKSNGQPGSPCDREDRNCLTPMHSSSPRSPCSQPSPQPPDSHYRDKLSPMDQHWLCPDQDPPDEDPPSPPGPSTSPSSTSALPAWAGGQVDPDTTRAVVESVDRLLRTLPRPDPTEVKTLLRMNKKMAKTVGHIFKMEAQDVNKEEEIRKYSLIYGRFDSKRREGKQLTHHELIINEAAAQFCIRDNALLLRRVELFSLARQVARKCAYASSLKHTRALHHTPAPASHPHGLAYRLLPPISPTPPSVPCGAHAPPPRHPALSVQSCRPIDPSPPPRPTPFLRRGFPSPAATTGLILTPP